MSRKLTIVAVAMLMAFCWLGSAEAGVIKFFHSPASVNLSNMNAINAFYNAQPGLTSSTTTASISAGQLAGVDLLMGWERKTAYNAGEVAAMSAFLAGGGRIALFGENAFFSLENNIINNAAAALGSSMSILNITVDPGFQTASGLQIPPHPLTAGVSSFEYAAPSAMAGISLGNVLFLSQDLARPWAGFDPLVGGDGLVIVADSNIADLGPNFDNDQFFLNLVNVSVVPEPATLVLMGTGLLAIGIRRRRS